ncbi:hypothetical protein [Rhodococcus sp. SGAir0479]|uniref:hypothetical protein n=1 Tax=Rhodococcus sp. SGAir0479 TaxID=2567884 RepID=UPI0010CD571F|nr:hypothetical protein [Rhodococcus sp. SGAir0479]QCQ92416.1 hypothetical protein E7742_15110 [Rhodococcus sp. SGAir0479]
MTSTVRASLSAAAALFAGAAATFVLLGRTQRDPMFSASGRQLGDWNSTVPTGVAVGCVLAVLAYAGLQRASSVRPAWIAAAAATVVLIAARLTVSGVSDLDQLTLLHYAKCLAAGVLLGAAVAAAWSRPPARLLLTGAVASTFVVAHTAHAGWTPSTSALGEPFWWVLIPALVLTAAGAILDADAPARADTTEVRAVLLAVVTLALAHRLLGGWIDGRTGASLQRWVVIGLCLVVIVALTEFWARRLASPFLLAATAVAASAPFVATVLAQDGVRVAPWLSVAAGVLAVAVGLAAGRWRPMPVVGLAVLAVVPLAAVIDPTPGSRAWFLVVLAVLGGGVGLALGSTLPDSGALAGLGLVVPLLSLVFTTVVGSTTVVVTYMGAYEPLSNIPMASNPHALDSPVTFDRAAGVALLSVVVFCGLALHGLRPRDTAAPRAD